MAVGILSCILNRVVERNDQRALDKMKLGKMPLVMLSSSFNWITEQNYQRLLDEMALVKMSVYFVL